jgi:hypothetical protein
MIDEAQQADTRMMGIVHGALRRDLLRTRDALTSVLLPHLDREVEEAMPMVSASITRAQRAAAR